MIKVENVTKNCWKIPWDTSLHLSKLRHYYIKKGSTWLDHVTVSTSGSVFVENERAFLIWITFFFLQFCGICLFLNNSLGGINSIFFYISKKTYVFILLYFYYSLSEMKSIYFISFLICWFGHFSFLKST